MDYSEDAQKIIDDTNDFKVERKRINDNRYEWQVADKDGKDITADMSVDKKREAMYAYAVRKMCQVKIATDPKEQDGYDKDIINKMLPQFERVGAYINGMIPTGKLDTSRAETVAMGRDGNTFKYTEQILSRLLGSRGEHDAFNVDGISHKEMFNIFANYHNTNKGVSVGKTNFDYENGQISFDVRQKTKQVENNSGI